MSPRACRALVVARSRHGRGAARRIVSAAARPRCTNKALFFTPAEPEPGAKSRALVEEWGRANLLRIAIVAGGWCALLAGAQLTMAGPLASLLE